MTVLSDQHRAEVRLAFVGMLNNLRSVCNLTAAEMDAKVTALDDAIGAFLGQTADADLTEQQLDWMLREIAVKRYGAKHDG